MKMIIGGAYQGKKKYAIEKYNLFENELLNGEIMSIENDGNISCIYNFHKLIKRILNRPNFMEYINLIIEKNPNLIIITDEIGNGIVPIDKEDRIWRETVGNVCCYIAKKSDIVTRIICGIPINIKGN